MIRNDYNHHLDIERTENLKMLKAMLEQAKTLESRPEALYAAVRGHLAVAIKHIQDAINEYESPF